MEFSAVEPPNYKACSWKMCRLGLSWTGWYMPQSPAGETEALQLYPGPVSDSQVGKPRSHSDFSMLDNVRVLKLGEAFKDF